LTWINNGLVAIILDINGPLLSMQKNHSNQFYQRVKMT
jgi:hypothetical protein